MNNDDDSKKPLGGHVPLPGVMAVSLYLLLVAGTIVAGVVGRRIGALYLVFAAAFVSASAGLIVGFRWAWSLALSAVFLLMSFSFWIFAARHQTAMVVPGCLNLLIFLYLIRPEVRERMR
jgi:hypothetical protein